MKVKRSRTAEALALLGLAQRAGAVVKGTEATRQALRRGEARLVLVAGDGSEGQKGKVLPLAEARGVPVETLGSQDELGAAVGSGPLAAAAVTRSSFAKQVRGRLGRD
jgi:ribosomal protein L7Ae-like RNA K-turn-binding protein